MACLQVPVAVSISERNGKEGEAWIFHVSRTPHDRLPIQARLRAEALPAEVQLA